MSEDSITDLPPFEFLSICAGWKAEMEETGEWDAIQADLDLNVLKCPVHLYTQANGLCKRTTGGTRKCPICGNYMCPACMNHASDVMSRITGYIQAVSGWNAAKKQEFEDRQRHKVSNGL